MKKLVLFGAVLSLVLSSCADLSPELLDPEAYENQNIDYQPRDLWTAWEWVSSNIKYESDPFQGNKKLPEVTYREKKGDCDDYALLLAYFCYKIGYDTKILIVKDNGSFFEHALLEVNGNIIEPRIFCCVYNESDLTIVRPYDYKDAFYDYSLR